MTQTRTPSLDTHDERPRRSHSGTLGWDTNKRLIAGHVRERGSDHVNVLVATVNFPFVATENRTL